MASKKRRRGPKHAHQDRFADFERGLAELIDPPTLRGVSGTNLLPPGSDYYIGRTVTGSDVIVSAIREQYPDSPLITHDGMLVLPLMRRHALSGIPHAAVQNVFERVQRSEDVLGESVAFVTNGVEARAKTKPTRSIVLCRSVVDRQDPENQFIPEVFAIYEGFSENNLPIGEPFLPDVIRIAEVKRHKTAIGIAYIAREHIASGDILELSPAEVCEAPRKRG